MVIAIGKGGQADVADQFKNLNAGAVDISYDGGTDFGGGGSSDDSDSGMAMMAPGGRRRLWRRFWRSTLRRYGEAVPHREARRRADHRGERCLPVTAAVCRIWEAFSADRAIWKTA